MDRLTAEDRLMLWPDERWPQDIGVLAVVDGTDHLESDGRFRLEGARDQVERRLHLLPRFRQVLYTPRRGLGWPLWVDAPDFDISHHVVVAQVPAPGDERQLLHTVELLRRRRLDRARPLWEMWFLPGLPDARVGLFIRLHHVMGDGMAGVANLGAFLDLTPETSRAAVPPWEPSPWPSSRDLLADNLHRRADDAGRSLSALAQPGDVVRRARAAWPALRELFAEGPGPRTSLNRVVGSDRRLALLRTSLSSVKDVADAHDATVNDVLLAMTSGGLRGLLHSRGEPVDDLRLPIYVPVSLRPERPGHGGGNLISQMVVRLPVGLEDPSRRLRQIAAQTAQRKALVRASLGTTFRSRLVSNALLPLVARQRVNVETADLPGPQESLYFAGARLLEVFPLLNLIGNVSLGVGAMSYAGQFNVMVVGDGDCYPDLEVFTAAARSDLRSLIEVTGATPTNRSAHG